MDKYLKNIKVAQKAIVALYCARLEKTPGTAGVGANREDHPVFTQLVDRLLADVPVSKDDLYAAVQRVQKYHRQVAASKYGKQVQDDTVGLSHMLTHAKMVRARHEADTQLQSLINERRKTYGDW